MIFCVDNDSNFLNMMIYTFQSSGIQALGLSSGEELLLTLETQVPQLIMLEIMLPGKDGLVLLQELRTNPLTASIPIIMATAKSTEYDRVVGLDAGADDYLSKPFGMMEMVARVKAVLRRVTPPHPQAVLKMGDLALNVQSHSTTVGGETVTLALKEFQLLEMLLAQRGMVFTRDQILSSIWDVDYDGETRTIDVHVRSLRSKLKHCGKYIQTVRGVGYRMVAPEEIIPEDG